MLNLERAVLRYMVRRNFLISALFCALLFAFTACGGDDDGSGHNHSYSTEWSYNATQHWHECSCGAKTDEDDHSGDDPCTVCGRLSYNLGDTGPGGGKIFYRIETGFIMTDDNTTAHYLEAAPADMETTLAWASSAFIPSSFGGTGSWTDIAGTATGIGTGRKNTALILATDADAPAAKACADYSNNGKTDWFLPSRDELRQLYTNRTSVGNMGTSVYWSSSQIFNNNTWFQSFSDGVQNYLYKNLLFSVRAVRAF